MAMFHEPKAPRRSIPPTDRLLPELSMVSLSRLYGREPVWVQARSEVSALHRALKLD